MQFRVKLHVNKSLGGITVEGSTVQCIRLTQEKNANGRRQAKVITTIDRWNNELSAEAKGLLSEEEQEQWVKWKSEHDDEYRRRQLSIALTAAPATINAAAAALRDATGDVSDPESLWEAIDNLGAQLVRAGHEKPKRPRGRPSTPPQEEDCNDPLSSTWPRGNVAPLPNFAPVGSDAHRQYQTLLDTYEAFKRETVKAESHK